MSTRTHVMDALAGTIEAWFPAVAFASVLLAGGVIGLVLRRNRRDTSSSAAQRAGTSSSRSTNE